MDTPVIQEKRETVGKISSDLIVKEPDSRDPIELQREMTKDYVSELIDCALSFKKFHTPCDFFVTVLTKKERLMPNVLRNYFAARLSCPTPEYDQAVYRYNHAEDNLEFIWVLPSKDTCELLAMNALKVHPDERLLLEFVLRLYDGDLLRLSKKLNNEFN
jgi:hypothetical protein